MKRITEALFFLYMAWAVIVLTRGIWITLAGEFREKIGNEAFQSFFIVFTVVLISILSVGAALAWFATKGNAWAKWLFVTFCFIYAIDSLLGTVQITEMYQYTSKYSWFRGPVSIVVWTMLGGLAFYTRPNKSLKSGTPQSGAP